MLGFAEKLYQKLPSSGQEIVRIAHGEGCGDMFPHLTREEAAAITADGKIPVFPRWKERLKEGTIAPDTLLTLAGLASFTNDQALLDQRILGIIG